MVRDKQQRKAAIKPAAIKPSVDGGMGKAHYRPPQLVRYGDVRSATLGGSPAAEFDSCSGDPPCGAGYRSA